MSDRNQILDVPNVPNYDALPAQMPLRDYIAGCALTGLISFAAAQASLSALAAAIVGSSGADLEKEIQRIKQLIVDVPKDVWEMADRVLAARDAKPADAATAPTDLPPAGASVGEALDALKAAGIEASDATRMVGTDRGKLEGETK